MPLPSPMLYAHFHAIPCEEYGGGEGLSDASHPTSWRLTSLVHGLTCSALFLGLWEILNFPLREEKCQEETSAPSLWAGWRGWVRVDPGVLVGVVGLGQGWWRRPRGRGGPGPPDGTLRDGLASDVHAHGTCVPGKVLVERKVVVVQSLSCV